MIINFMGSVVGTLLLKYTGIDKLIKAANETPEELMKIMQENEQMTFEGMEVEEDETEYDDFPERWTDAVNRLRRYVGKKEFEVPERMKRK